MSIQNMFNSKSLKALFVFAHPDDIVLSCGGTVARFISDGIKVYNLELTLGKNSFSDGSDSRSSESRSSANFLGYQLFQEDLDDGDIRFNLNLCKIIDKYLVQLEPDILITHFPQEKGFGHQDHFAVASAVVSCGLRKRIPFIAYSEPLVNFEFSPNLFIDISNYITRKIDSVKLHQSELHKHYLSESVLRARANWWALQSNRLGFDEKKYSEALSIVISNF